MGWHTNILYDSDSITKKTIKQPLSQKCFEIFIIIFTSIGGFLILFFTARAILYVPDKSLLHWIGYSNMIFSALFLYSIIFFGILPQPDLKRIKIAPHEMIVIKRKYIGCDKIIKIPLNKTTYCFSNEASKFPMLVILYPDANREYQTTLLDKDHIPNLNKLIGILSHNVNFNSKKRIVYIDAKKMCKVLSDKN
jgi:hypothetical protein